jgi:PBSX family phage terminase large subunit
MMSNTPTIKATKVFQKNWLASKQYRYIINSGSSRSSKTYSIIQLFYLYALQNPGKKLSVFRDTKQICKQTVLEDMKKIYNSMPGAAQTLTLNLTESIFRFKNGSSIHIEGTDDSVKIHGYHCDVLWINEGYSVSRDTFDQLDMRCKDFVILDLNPRQSHWSEDIAKAPNAILIHSTWRDNSFIPPEQKIKILSYQPVKASEAVESGILGEQEAKSYDVLANPKNLTDKQINELIGAERTKQRTAPTCSTMKFIAKACARKNLTVSSIGKKSALNNTGR